MPWARSSSVFQKRYNFLGVSFIPFHKSVSPTHIFLQVLNLMKMTIRYCRYPNQSSLSSHFLLSIPTPASPLFQIRALPITQFLEVETSVILFHHQPFTFTSVFKFCQFFFSTFFWFRPLALHSHYLHPTSGPEILFWTGLPSSSPSSSSQSILHNSN